MQDWAPLWTLQIKDVEGGRGRRGNDGTAANTYTQEGGRREVREVMEKVIFWKRPALEENSLLSVSGPDSCFACRRSSRTAAPPDRTGSGPSLPQTLESCLWSVSEIISSGWISGLPGVEVLPGFLEALLSVSMRPPDASCKDKSPSPCLWPGSGMLRAMDSHLTPGQGAASEFVEGRCAGGFGRLSGMEAEQVAVRAALRWVCVTPKKAGGRPPRALLPGLPLALAITWRGADTRSGPECALCASFQICEAAAALHYHNPFPS